MPRSSARSSEERPVQKKRAETVASCGREENVLVALLDDLTRRAEVVLERHAEVLRGRGANVRAHLGKRPTSARASDPRSIWVDCSSEGADE